MHFVLGHAHEHPSQWAALRSIANKPGMTPQTLRTWVRRAETNRCLQPGLTTQERKRPKES